MTLSEFKSRASSSLASLYDRREISSIVLTLLCTRLGIPQYRIVAEPGMTIPPEKESALDDDLAQLSAGRPLQYVTGRQEFCGHRFKVGEGCLIPRPETEEMVDMIIRSLDDGGCEGPFNILDLCTGSGCIAWSLAAAFPQAQVFACDVSDAALGIACRQRVKLYGAKPVFFKADILQAPPAGLPEFDLVVCNPPYIMESEKALMHRNVLEYEPSEALFVPDDNPLLFYGALGNWASRLLAPSGEVWCEVNERLGGETAALLGHGAEVLRDVNGRERFVHYRK